MVWSEFKCELKRSPSLRKTAPNTRWVEICSDWHFITAAGLDHHYYSVIHKRQSSSRGKAKRQACNAPDRRLIRRPSEGGGRDKEDMPRMHCCLCDALFNSADNQIQLVQRSGGEVALSALERSWWVSQNTCYSVKRCLWLGHIHCWASGFRKRKKKLIRWIFTIESSVTLRTFTLGVREINEWRPP